MERVLEQVWNEAKTLGNDVDNAILHNTYVYIYMYIYYETGQNCQARSAQPHKTLFSSRRTERSKIRMQ